MTWIQTTYELLQEWQLLYRDQYISKILDLEKPPADLLCLECRSQQGSFQCKECFSQSLLCHSCFFAVHKNMPLHHIKKWTGQFFNATSLNQEGFILYLGHNGEPCPKIHHGRSGKEIHAQSSDEDGSEGEGGGEGEGVPLAGWEKKDGRCMVVVDTSGIHQLRIGWCRCETAAEPHIQLLRNQVFPASMKRPSTAFTFSVLDYFHIDSVECKTSASSFFSKLRRLTKNSSPHSIPVCQGVTSGWSD